MKQLKSDRKPDLDEFALTCMRNLLSSGEERVYFKDRQSRFLLVSAAWVAACAPGRTAAELIGKTDFDVFGGEHASAAFEDEQRIIRTGEPIVGKVERETFMGRPDCWVSSMKMPLRDGDGDIIGTYGISRDVTAQIRAEKALAHQALHDPLTGLPNRIALMDRLAQALLGLERSGVNRLGFDRPGAERRRSRVAVLFVDLDNFKEVNDSYGHDAGDLVLVEVARRLSALARRTDTVARLGGDEFVVLCGDLDPHATAGLLGDRIIRSVAMPYTDGGRDLSVTCSVGIGTASETDAEPDRLMREADAAMYEAKKAGGGRCRPYDPAHRSRAQKDTLYTQLARGIGRGELFLVYQPVYSLKAQVLSGAEALVRWRHPDGRVLLPDEFIPLAEESGLIGRIGSFVLEEACGQLAQWTALDGWPDPFTLAVNLSGRELSDSGLPVRVGAVTRSHGLDPGRLCLEITETALIGEVGDVQEILAALAATGARIALDDFGTGYSTLVHLQRLNADVLKIDRSFVEHISRSRRDREIVAAVTAMSHALGMTVVGEGIETSRQLNTLAALGCDEGQGLLFGHPLPPDEVAAQALAGRRGRRYRKVAAPNAGF
ncbi:MAG TPA: EAL domain-containing protein [Streptosporangiaceae bacterium]|nr:EAL domain-containing protein [Streptosporangiaceae bacterium]